MLRANNMNKTTIKTTDKNYEFEQLKIKLKFVCCKCDWNRIEAVLTLTSEFTSAGRFFLSCNSLSENSKS